MPSNSKLPEVLAQLLSPKAQLYRGTVQSVAGGAAVVKIDGSNIPRITYPRDDVPAAGDEVLLIGQEGFGLTIFSVPAVPTSQGTQPAPVVTLVEPSTVANRTPSAWETAPTTLRQRQAYASAGVWFYARTVLSTLNPSTLASVEMRLTRTGGSYVVLAQHNTAAPTGSFAPDDDPTRLLSLTEDAETWVALPLAWGKALIAGTRLGITARSADYDADLDLDGTLRFTTL